LTLRVEVVGMSVGGTCGVHDHAMLLAEALSREGVCTSSHWLWRSERSLRGARSEIGSWARELAPELERSRPDAVLLHYSVFSYSHRGLPLFVPPTLSALRRARVPVVPVMHEFVFPWALGGLRGKAWAVTQRAALIDVMRAATAVVVTTDSRASWLTSRPWLPRRRVVIAPVFSNLPPPTVERREDRPCPLLGLFGYSEAGAPSLVLDALRALRDRGVQVKLTLLGGPGRSSAAGETWLAAASSRGLEGLLSFSEVLPAQSLSNALADCDVLLFVDPSGPTSRKGTLAGSLASGRPVVAIDGPQRWSELLRREAAEVVAPTSQAVADAVAALLADEPRREALGARGRTFAEQETGVARSAEVVSALLGEVVAGGS
jgi:glycosyltransferase involved in cell wall biosynthesis